MRNKPGYLAATSLSIARIVGRWALVLLGISQAGVLLLLTYYPGRSHGARFPTWMVLSILFVMVGCGAAGFWARRAFSGKLALCASLPVFIGSWAVLSQRTTPGVLETRDWTAPSSMEAAPLVLLPTEIRGSHNPVRPGGKMNGVLLLGRSPWPHPSTPALILFAGVLVAPHRVPQNCPNY